MKFRITLYSIFCFVVAGFSQSVSPTNRINSNLNFGSSLPSGFCAGRSIVLYESSYTEAELQEAQQYFQQSGIDAVLYLDVDYVFSGVDPSRTFSNYFSTREIRFFIFLQKENTRYQVCITEYNGTKELIDKQHTSWKSDEATFPGLLQALYRFSLSTQKRANLLINDVPEKNYSPRFFREREERFPGDVRTAKVAIPRMSNENDNKALENFLKEKFPFKYQFVDPLLTDKELREDEFRLVLHFVNTRGDVARDILGYDVTQTASTLDTHFFADDKKQTKAVPSKKMIYKFYFKNTEYGNIFLGTQWDADETWLDALRNHILFMRQELRP